MSRNVHLTPAQLRQFVNEGFLHLRDVVPSEMTTPLLEELQDQGYPNQHRWGPPSAFESSYTQPYEYLRPMLKQLVGMRQELMEIVLAVRFARQEAPPTWHIDGIGFFPDRNDYWDLLPMFQLLLGVFLTDVPPASGNLLVSPAGHYAIERFFRADGSHFFRGGRVSDPEDRLTRQLLQTPIPDLVPIVARRGDVVICHSLLPHMAGPNLGNTRPVVYYRLGRSPSSGYEALTNVWLGWSEFGLTEPSNQPSDLESVSLT